METQRGWSGMGRDPVSHFACSSKVKEKVVGMQSRGLHRSKLDLDRRYNFVWIGHGFFSGSTMDFFQSFWLLPAASIVDDFCVFAFNESLMSLFAVRQDFLYATRSSSLWEWNQRRSSLPLRRTLFASIAAALKQQWVSEDRRFVHACSGTISSRIQVSSPSNLSTNALTSDAGFRNVSLFSIFVLKLPRFGLFRRRFLAFNSGLGLGLLTLTLTLTFQIEFI